MTCFGEKEERTRTATVVVVDFYLSDMPEDLHILHNIHKCYRLTGPAIVGL